MSEEVQVKEYADDEVPSEKDIAEAMNTLVQLCLTTGGSISGGVARTKKDGTPVATLHIDIHDASLCGHDSITDALAPTDKRQVN